MYDPREASSPKLPGTYPAPPAEKKAPSAAASAFISRCWAWTHARVLAAGRCLGAWRSRARTGLDATWKCLRIGGRLVSRLWQPLVIALGIGAIVGVGASLLGPWLSTTAGGLAGCTTSLAVQATQALREAAGRVAPATD
jgi:hypothetical protein